MTISIERIQSAAQAVAAAQIRSEVFGRELRCRIANPIDASKPSLHLLARIQPIGKPIAALSVVDTTGDTGLHESYALPFGSRARVARYTQLAVLKPYRGRHVPLRLILEAHWSFVVPERFEYAWLLFNADRARDSSLCRLLGFRPGADTFESEYGRVRTLSREENNLRLENRGRHSDASLDAADFPVALASEYLTYSTNGTAGYPTMSAELQISQPSFVRRKA